MNSAAERSDLVDVIVVDDRPAEEVEIRQLLKEECGCNPIFYTDYRDAYKAVLEQVGRRLLVNYQLGRKDLGQALLQKLQDKQLDVPTIVINCQPKSRRAVSTYCAQFGFVAGTIEADEVHTHIAVMRRAFTREVPRAIAQGKPTIFVIHGRDVAAVSAGTEAAVERFARILRVKLDVDIIVLKGEPFDGGTLIQQIEGYFKRSAVAIALLTADDVGSLKGAMKLAPRVRQNVLFEVGFARGYLGAQQTIIFRDHDLELPSDLGGIRTLDINEPDEQIAIAVKQVFDNLGLKVPMKRL